MKALLLSGGIESTCIAYWKRPDICVTIDYGQVCAHTEVETAKAICKRLKLEHSVIEASPGRKFGLLGATEALRDEKPEFWPFRNQFLGTVAAMALYERDVREIWFGTVKSDTKFLDGSRSFFNAFSELVSAQEGCVRIKAPAIGLSTERLIRLSRTPRSVLGATFSCHRGSLPCGDCPGCWKQKRLLYSKPVIRPGNVAKRTQQLHGLPMAEG
jgi:7-cyano-7-deazaguanine synthase